MPAEFTRNVVDAEIDTIVRRLLGVLDVQVPYKGSVLLDFHEGYLVQVRPTPIITVRRQDKVHR